MRENVKGERKRKRMERRWKVEAELEKRKRKQSPEGMIGGESIKEKIHRYRKKAEK